MNAVNCKAFVRFIVASHVRASPYYPQSNDKKERFHQALMNEAIRRQTPLSLDGARRIAGHGIRRTLEAARGSASRRSTHSISAAPDSYKSC